MQIPIQLDLFKTAEQCEIDALREWCDKLCKSNGAVRRGLFARHNELQKRMNELEQRLKIIEENICYRK